MIEVAAKIMVALGIPLLGWACWVLYHNIQLSFEILLRPMENKKPKSCKRVMVVVRIISATLFLWAFIEYMRKVCYVWTSY